MPYGRKLRRNYGRKVKRFFRKGRSSARKSYTRSRKFSRTKVRIPTRVLPDYTLVKMKASTNITTSAGTTPGVGTYSYSNFQCCGNDIFDPFQTFSIDQPNGFDQWMAFYKSFIVHKSSIKVTPIYWVTDPLSSGGPIMPFQLTIVPITGGSAYPPPLTTAYSELPYSKSKIFTGTMPVSNGTAPAPSPNPGQLYMPGLVNSMMTKKILGYKDLSDVADVRGTATSSPLALFNYFVLIRSMVPGSGATLTNYRLSPIGFRVDMYFKCQLLDRLNVPDSTQD